MTTKEKTRQNVEFEAFSIKIDDFSPKVEDRLLVVNRGIQRIDGAFDLVGAGFERLSKSFGGIRLDDRLACDCLSLRHNLDRLGFGCFAGFFDTVSDDSERYHKGKSAEDMCNCHVFHLFFHFSAPYNYSY